MVTLRFNTLVTDETTLVKMCDGMRLKGISVLSYFITEYDVSDDDYDVKCSKKCMVKGLSSSNQLTCQSKQ